jgi:hypothetical protein
MSADEEEEDEEDEVGDLSPAARAGCGDLMRFVPFSGGILCVSW